MAWENEAFVFARRAGVPLTNVVLGTGRIYKAIALDDGDIAVNGQEAGGILLFGGDSGENVTLGWFGRMRFTAASCMGPGARVSVQGSGYMVLAGSNDYIVGRVMDEYVDSGAVGWGLFSFAHPAYYEQRSFDTSHELNFTTANNLSAAGDVGKGVDIEAGDFAAAPAASGVMYTGAASGGTAMARLDGRLRVRAGGVVTNGRSITVAASGWFVDAGSGDRIVGRALAASAAGNSGGLFDATVHFANFYATNCFDVNW